MLDSMEHYKKLFSADRQNDREKVMRNTYALNEMLHKKDIDERNRSQFVGTCLLFVKHEVERYGHGGRITDAMKEKLRERWYQFTPNQIRAAIGEVLEGLLDGSPKLAAEAPPFTAGRKRHYSLLYLLSLYA